MTFSQIVLCVIIVLCVSHITGPDVDYVQYAPRVVQEIPLELEESEGQEIETGPEPQIEQAQQEQQNEPAELKRLVLKFKHKNDWTALLHLGDLYRTGSYPLYRPNEMMAMNIYKLAGQCPDASVAGLAQARFVQVRLAPIASGDQGGSSLPLEQAYEALELAKKLIKTLPYNAFRTPRVSRLERRHVPPTRAPVVNAEPVAQPVTQPVTQPVRVQTQGVNRPRQLHTGRQNVHDHGISSTTRINIDSLKARATAKVDIGSALCSVQNEVLSGQLSADQKTRALQVIDRLSDSVHSNFNVSDKEVLGLVWNTIQTHGDRISLQETLCKQLSESVENGYVVCQSGRIARIVASLDGTGILNTGIPLEVIANEIAGMASSVRTTTMKTWTPLQIEKYNASDNSMKTEVSNMKAELRRMVGENFGHLGLNSAIIEPIVAVYESSF